MSSEQHDEKVTLRQFIEENHKLLSSLGIFVALVVFASNLRLAGLSSWLAFLFLAMAVLVLWEVMAVFPRGRASERLHWFGVLLVMVILLLLLYWLVHFRPMWKGLLWIPATMAFLWLLSVFVKGLSRTDMRTRYGRSQSRLHEVFSIVAALLLGLAILFVIILATKAAEPGIYGLLESLCNSLEPICGK